MDKYRVNEPESTQNNYSKNKSEFSRPFCVLEFTDLSSKEIKTNAAEKAVRALYFSPRNSKRSKTLATWFILKTIVLYASSETPCIYAKTLKVERSRLPRGKTNLQQITHCGLCDTAITDILIILWPEAHDRCLLLSVAEFAFIWEQILSHCGNPSTFRKQLNGTNHSKWHEPLFRQFLTLFWGERYASWINIIVWFRIFWPSIFHPPYCTPL